MALRGKGGAKGATGTQDKAKEGDKRAHKEVWLGSGPGRCWRVLAGPGRCWAPGELRRLRLRLCKSQQKESNGAIGQSGGCGSYTRPAPGKPGAADLIAPRIPPGRFDGLWLGWKFDCLNVALDGCRDAF